MTALVTGSVILLLLVSSLSGVSARVSGPLSSRSRGSLPVPTSYSAMGDSITTAFDANGSAANLGSQPYYSYAVGWNTSVLSLNSRLNRLYGQGTVTPHLLAVPGDKAVDMVGQARAAVANGSEFVTVLVGGNDVCNFTGSYPNVTFTPTPVASFSNYLNQTFSILRTGLPSSTVISLGNVVNVTRLWTLFSSNLQAVAVYTHTCPALLSAAGRATMQAAIAAYNQAEVPIIQHYQLIPFNIFDFNFSAPQVNDVDYFHPSISGHQALAALWWQVLPYANGLPRIVPPAYPPYLPVGSPLLVTLSAVDVEALSAQLTYLPVGATSWVAVSMSQTGGLPYNGTFAATVPANATAGPGSLELYVSVQDTSGNTATYPAGAGPPPANFTRIPVVGPMVVSVTLSGNRTPAGQPVTVGTNVTNGSGTIVYGWKENGTVVPQNTSSFSFVPPGAGNYSFTASVVDQLGRVANGSTLLTVLPGGNSSPPGPTIVSFTTSPSSLVVGESSVLRVSASGGTGPLSYVYTGLPLGCGTRDAANLSCTPSVPGNFTLRVYVNDTAGRSVTATTPLVVVPAGTPSLTSISVTPDNVTMGIGETTSAITAVPECTTTCPATGIVYAWTTSRPLLGHSNASLGASITFTAGDTPGNLSLYVNATLGGATRRAGPVQVTVLSSAPPALTGITVTPPSASVLPGGQVSFHAVPACSGPCPAGTIYSWSLAGDAGALNSTMGSSVRLTAGTHTGKVTLFVNASLNGKTVEGLPVVVTITEKSSAPGTSSLVFEGILGAVGVAVALVALALFFRRRRRSDTPATQPDLVACPQCNGPLGPGGSCSSCAVVWTKEPAPVEGDASPEKAEELPPA